MRCIRTVAFVAILALSAAQHPGAEARPSTLKDSSGTTIDYGSDPSELYKAALAKAEAAGHTFETMTTSYTRLLTTLVNLGFSTGEVNTMMPEFTSRLGVKISGNPGTVEAETPKWVPVVSDELQKMLDALSTHKMTLDDWFKSIGWRNGPRDDGYDYGPKDIYNHFGIEVTRTLKEIWTEWQEAKDAAKEVVKDMDETEKKFTVAQREQMYDYQCPRWHHQCMMAYNRFDNAWRALLPHADDTNGVETYSDVMNEAIDVAHANMKRFNLGLVVTDEDPPTEHGDTFNATWMQKIHKEYTKMTVSTVTKHHEHANYVVMPHEAPEPQDDRGRHPKLAPEMPEPPKHKLQDEFENGTLSKMPGDIHFREEDISGSLCAFYHSLRRIVEDGKVPGAKEITDEQMESLRRLILHFRSAVQYNGPKHTGSFFDADLVVIDGLLYRYGALAAQIVHAEIKRALPESERLSSFEQFHRELLEESYFFMRSVQEQVVHNLARDVPEGSVVVIAYPTRECKEELWANGTVHSQDDLHCTHTGDQMDMLVKTLHPRGKAPLFSKKAHKYHAWESPVVVAPMDAAARFDPEFDGEDHDQAHADGLIPMHRLRVDYNIEVFQWAEPREPLPHEEPPVFKSLEEIEAEEMEESAREAERLHREWEAQQKPEDLIPISYSDEYPDGDPGIMVEDDDAEPDFVPPEVHPEYDGHYKERPPQYPRMPQDEL